jgi:dTMP kinase
MIPNSNPGKLIVIEGLDGAGTTTQLDLLTQTLQKQNILVWTTREPSEGIFGSLIRGYQNKDVFLGENPSVKNNVLAGLFSADRLDHLYSPGGVIDCLKKGTWVVTDRYYLSSFAYQAMDMSHEEKLWLNSLHNPCIQPDITVFVDVSIETSMRRIAVNRAFQFDPFEETGKLTRVRDQYLKAIEGLRRLGEVIHIISGELPVEDVQTNIWERIESRLLDKSFLPYIEEQQVWAFGSLKRIRQQAEDTLSLTYLGTKYTPPSYNPKDSTKGNAGGAYQLIFLDNLATKYRVVAWLNSSRNRITKIKAQTDPSGREKIETLDHLCRSAYNSYSNQLQFDFQK